MKGGSSFFQIERIIEQTGDKTSGQRADPVDSVMGPVWRGQRRPKGPRGVQSGSGERPGNEEAEGEGQADAEDGDGARRAFCIDGCGEHREHKKKRRDTFKSYACPNRKISSELRSAESDGAPGRFGDYGFQQERGSRRAHQLRGPIEEGFDRANTLGNPEADGHSWIEMSAGDVAESGNHDGDSEAVRERNAKKAEAACAVQILIGANRAGAEENQRKCSEEFRDQLLRCAVHR